MRKKCIFGIILFLTFFACMVIFLLTTKSRYQSFVVDKVQWEDIIKNRTMNKQLKIEDILFNDYRLIVDNSSSEIYYSFVESKNQYNPVIDYKGSQKNFHIAIREKMAYKIIQEQKPVEIVVYDDNFYHVYQLNISSLPMIHISYHDKLTKSLEANVVVFDNRKRTSRRIIKSLISLLVMEDDNYMISFRQDSIGHNERKYEISLFDNKMTHEFILKKFSVESENSGQKVELFINNTYQGIYVLEPRN